MQPDAGRPVSLYYRTADMQDPLLEFAPSKDGKYAVRATIVPTFDQR